MDREHSDKSLGGLDVVPRRLLSMLRYQVKLRKIYTSIIIPFKSGACMIPITTYILSENALRTI